MGFIWRWLELCGFSFQAVRVKRLSDFFNKENYTRREMKTKLELGTLDHSFTHWFTAGDWMDLYQIIFAKFILIFSFENRRFGEIRLLRAPLTEDTKLEASSFSEMKSGSGLLWGLFVKRFLVDFCEILRNRSRLRVCRTGEFVECVRRSSFRISQARCSVNTTASIGKHLRQQRKDLSGHN